MSSHQEKTKEREGGKAATAGGASTSKSNDEILALKLARKNALLRELEDKVLHLSDEIKHRTTHLRAKRTGEKSLRVANARIASHMKEYATDLKNRPPDRGDDIRQYTKMDLDVWKYPQVREWFNSQASDEDFGYHLTPAETGYMIRLEPDYVPAHKR